MPHFARHNIYLTGFMASGKTTIGRKLAQILHRRFVDSDALIEMSAGMEIPKIFKKKGEDFFRGLESQILQQVSRQQGLVVALGGGAVLRPQNRALLRRGHWIYLHVPLVRILQRLARPGKRPLAKNIKQLTALYNQRQGTYRQAQHLIDCGTLAPDAIAQKIRGCLCSR